MTEQAENRPASINGCSWGRETRVMVDNMKDYVIEIKESVKDQNIKLDSVIKATAGKPSWFVTGLISVLGMLCVGLITYIVTCQDDHTASAKQDIRLVSLSPKEPK